jgi:hypothetical protein
VHTFDIASPAWVAYGEAALAVCHRADPLNALRRSIDLDPGHAAAAADLEALTGEPVPQPSPRSPWERRHVEIVRQAVADPRRAEALLREHALRDGCDPLALLVVSRAVGDVADERLADLRGTSCSCWTSA